MKFRLQWCFNVFFFAALCECSADDKSVGGALYTLVHIEGLASGNFGTPRFALDMPVTLYDSSTVGMSSIKLLQRRVVVVKLETLLGEENPADTEFFVNTAGVASIVYVLPDVETQLTSKLRDLVEVLQSDLMSRVWPVPIFISRNTEAKHWLKNLEMRTRTDGAKGLLPSVVKNGILRDVINLRVWTKIQVAQQPALPGKNISGWLKRKMSAEESARPVFAIVTHYDDFNLSPAFANSAAGGSGLVAMLELANRLSSVFKDHEEVAKYDILFLATGGSPLAFRGLQQWLADADESVLSRIQFALCLDALVSTASGAAGAPSFTLHSSRDLEGNSTNDLVKLLNKNISTAGSSEPSLSFKTKKVRVYEQLSMPWQHEHFAPRRILSATLSTHNEATPYIRRMSLLESSFESELIEGPLTNVIDILSSAIVGYIFDSEPDALAAEKKVKEDNHTSHTIQKIVDDFANTPRFFDGMRPSLLEKYTTALESKFQELLTAGTVSRSGFTYTAGAAERRALRDETDSDAQTALRLHFSSLKDIKVFLVDSDGEAEVGTVQFSLKTSKGFLFDLAAITFSAALMGMVYAFLKFALAHKHPYVVLPEAVLNGFLSTYNRED